MCPVTRFARVVSVPSLWVSYRVFSFFWLEECNCYIIFEHKAQIGTGNMWFALFWETESHEVGLPQDQKRHQRLGKPKPVKALSPAPESLCLMLPEAQGAWQDFRG